MNKEQEIINRLKNMDALQLNILSQVSSINVNRIKEIIVNKEMNQEELIILSAHRGGLNNE